MIMKLFLHAVCLDTAVLHKTLHEWTLTVSLSQCTALPLSHSIGTPGLLHVC